MNEKFVSRIAAELTEIESAGLSKKVAMLCPLGVIKG